MAKKHLIFIVDDDYIFLEMLRETLLDRTDLEIVGFQTGEACLAELDRQPEVIVLDHHLSSKNPEAQNGLEILKEIKKHDEDLKVIIVSGQEDGTLVYDFSREKAFDYVIKDEDAFDNIYELIGKIVDKNKS